ERLDDRQDAADVVDRCAAQVGQRRGGDHRAHAVAREELEQQRAVVMAGNQMRALDAVFAGANRAWEVILDVGRQLAAAGEQRLRVVRRKLAQQLAAAVADAVGFHQENQLVGRQVDGDLGRDLFQRQVEYLPSRRVPERRHQHYVAVVEPLPYRGDVDAADFAGPLHVDAVEHADRLGRQEVAADDPDARARHRRVGDAEGQQRLDAAARMAGSLEHAVERLGIGHAQPAVVLAGDTLLLEDGFDLRPRSVHDDQTDAQALQQIEVMHDAEEGFVGDDLAAESDDEGLATKRMDIGRGRADPLHERPCRGRMRCGVDTRNAWHRIEVAWAAGAADYNARWLEPKRRRDAVSPIITLYAAHRRAIESQRSADRRPLDGAHLSDGFAFTRESQPRTARRGDAAARVGADPRRRRQRQDARPDDAHRVAARHRAGESAVDPGGDVHQQGRPGNDVAPFGADAG